MPLVVAAVAVLFAAACSGDDGEGAPAGAGIDGVRATTTTAPAGCAPARPAEPGTTTRTLDDNGATRTYELTIPAGYDGTTPAPVLLNLHGFGGNGRIQNESTAMPAEARARGYVVAAPDGGPLSAAAGVVPGGSDEFVGIPFWNFFGSSGVTFSSDTTGDEVPPDASALGADDVGFLSGLLDALAAELCVDEDRLYSTGMSNGAGMTTTLGCELGDRIAAIAPVAGVNLTGACPGDEPVPVLAVHGDADAIVHYTGNHLLGFALGNPSVPDRMAQWARRNRCAAEPVVDEPVPGVVRSVWTDCAPGVATELWTVTGGGHVWPRPAPDVAPGASLDVTDVVLDFFDAHVRADG